MSSTRYVNPFTSAAFAVLRDDTLIELTRVKLLEKYLEHMKNFSQMSRVMVRESGLVIDQESDPDDAILLGIESRLGGQTLLHSAALHGRPLCMKFLLNRGANKQAQTRHLKFTALNMAIFNNHEECVRILLAAKPYIVEYRDFQLVLSNDFATNLTPKIMQAKEHILHSLLHVKQQLKLTFKSAPLLRLALHNKVSEKNIRLLLNAGELTPNLWLDSDGFPFSLLSLLLNFHATIPKLSALLYGTLLAEHKRDPDDIHITYCLAAAEQQEHHIESAKNLYLTLAAQDFIPAYYRLGCIAEESQNNLRAARYYEQAIEAGDALAPTRLAELAHAAALRIQIERNAIRNQVDTFIISMCHKSFQKRYWDIELTSQQWLFFAMEAMVNEFVYPEPIAGIHTAITASTKAKASATNPQDLAEATDTSRQAWQFFHNVMSPNPGRKEKEISNNVSILNQRTTFFSAKLIAEYCDDDAKLLPRAVEDGFKLLRLI